MDAEADSEGVNVPHGWGLLNWQKKTTGQYLYLKVSEMRRDMFQAVENMGLCQQAALGNVYSCQL